MLLDGRQISTFGLQVFDAANTNLSGLTWKKLKLFEVQGHCIWCLHKFGVIHFIKRSFKHPGTSIEISSGGLANQESMLGKGNWDIFQASLDAAANDSGTFGYKINARYSENGEYEIETTALLTGGQLLKKQRVQCRCYTILQTFIRLKLLLKLVFQEERVFLE